MTRQLKGLSKKEQESYRKQGLSKQNKYCPRCEQLKPVTDFRHSFRNKDGLSSYCRCCHNLFNKEYRKRYLDKNRERQRGFSYRYFKTPGGRYTTIKQRVKRGNIELSISRQDFITWFTAQPLICHYCDRILDTDTKRDAKGHYRKQSLTIDRKDNNQGYTIDNICFACWLCNQIKSSIFTEDEMLYIGQNFLKLKAMREAGVGGKRK